MCGPHTSTRDLFLALSDRRVTLFSGMTPGFPFSYMAKALLDHALIT